MKEKENFQENTQQQNLVELAFVVNGEETKVKVNSNNKLKKAVEDALEQTSNANARPFEDWRVRYNNSLITNIDQKIEEYGFAPGSYINLSLDSGTGGNGTFRKS